MYARITYVSEIQFKTKIKVLRDWSFFPSYHYMDDISNRRYPESQSIHASLSSNNNIILKRRES
jgi:hypothetical protein